MRAIRFNRLAEDVLNRVPIDRVTVYDLDLELEVARGALSNGRAIDSYLACPCLQKIVVSPNVVSLIFSDVILHGLMENLVINVE